MTYTIYLAGPILHAEDGGYGWRERVIEEYGDKFDFINPLDLHDGNDPHTRIIYPGDDDSYVENPIPHDQIVADDKDGIRRSDGVLVGYQKDVPTWGTPQEEIWSYERGKIVGVWLGENNRRSPWRTEHCHVLSKSLEMCMQGMEMKLKRREAYD